jgi:thiosulfate reductase cytochrome b subunit
MRNVQMQRIYLYTRFERFWHWAQALLIGLLALTGLEVHGTYSLLGYKQAAELHNWAGISWFVLYTFVIFWEFTTGEWKQYIPTTKKLLAVVSYYLYGIFRGEPHPVPKSERNKHNPLQRLTYLGISVVLIPVQVVTGLLYYTYNSWPDWGLNLKLSTLAMIHTAGAYALLIFLIVHIYMTTTGHSLSAHLKAMWTGWEEVPKLPHDAEGLEKTA